MIVLAFGSTLAGFAIFLWGLRSLRSKIVSMGRFRMRGRWSTWLFGFVSTICGFLMMLTGAAAVLFLDMELVEVMAKSGLFMFAVAWILAFILECLYRICWRLEPTYAPQELRDILNTSHRARKKHKLKREHDDATSAGLIASTSKLAKTATNMFLLFASQLFNRVITPPRSWDKQNLWHPDEGREEQTRSKPKTMADVEHEDLLRESNRTDADIKALNVHDLE